MASKPWAELLCYPRRDQRLIDFGQWLDSIGSPVVQPYGLDPSNTRLCTHHQQVSMSAHTHPTHPETGSTKAQEVDYPCSPTQFPIAQSVNPWHQPTPWTANALTPRVHSLSPFAQTVKRISSSTKRERQSVNHSHSHSFLSSPSPFYIRTAEPDKLSNPRPRWQSGLRYPPHACQLSFDITGPRGSGFDLF